MLLTCLVETINVFPLIVFIKVSYCLKKRITENYHVVTYTFFNSPHRLLISLSRTAPHWTGIGEALLPAWQIRKRLSIALGKNY